MFLITISTAFVYLFLVSCPIAFGEIRGWDGGLASLPFTRSARTEDW